MSFWKDYKTKPRMTFDQTLPAETVAGILHSEQLWQWAASHLPKFRPELERLIPVTTARKV